MTSRDPGYRYLNLERRWPGFERDGLEIGSDGALRLAALPVLSPPSEESVRALSGPVGIGVDADGNLYLADAVEQRILRVDACDGRIEALPCLGGLGTDPGRLSGPRAVAVGPRGSLYVADTGNHRVQVIDLATLQVRAIWGSGGLTRPSRPTPGPGTFLRPWDVAANACSVWVADPGLPYSTGVRGWHGGSLQKLDAGGRPDLRFADTLASQRVIPRAPRGVVLMRVAGDDATSERLLVIDEHPRRAALSADGAPALLPILVYCTDGTLDAALTERWSGALGDDAALGAVTTRNGHLYVVDATGTRIHVFDAEGSFLGTTPTSGQVAGLAFDREGRLVVYPGSGRELRRSQGVPIFSTSGTFLAGPFRARTSRTRWQRLRLDLGPLPEHAHLRLFTLTSDGPGPPPPIPPLGAGTEDPGTIAETPHGVWRAAPWDVSDAFILNEPGRHLWIGGLLRGDGAATADLHQLRIDYDRGGWLEHLPALYRNDLETRSFLERALTLLESVYETRRKHIDELPLLFDPRVAPDHSGRSDVPGAWLDWLATWVEADLEEGWSEQQRREVVARAFEQHAWRGTRAGMERVLRRHAGSSVRVTELARRPGPWTLGRSPRLGLDTALPSAEPQGAVLARTAVVNRSNLIAEPSVGAPAFEDWVHRFVVHVHAGILTGERELRALRRVIDREKPAHTTYELCIVAPRMRVGLQARIGIDSMVGGSPPPAVLDERGRLDADAVLVDARGGEPPILDGTIRLGQGTILD